MGKELTGILFFLLIFIQPFFSQELRLSFNHLTQEEGLSEGTNAFVSTDSRGFVWISSLNGISRFDGRNVKKYLPVPGDSTALAYNIITSHFFEGANGDLWFSSYTAIQKYVRKEDQFRTYYAKDDKKEDILKGYYAFHLDDDGYLWVRVRTGKNATIRLVDTRTGKEKNNLGKLDGQRILPVLDQNNRVERLLLTLREEMGFTIADFQSDGNFTSQSFLEKDESSGEEGIKIFHIWPESRTEFWITSLKGFGFFSTLSGKLEYFPKYKGQSTGMVWDVEPFGADSLFVSTQLQGLLVFDRSDKKFVGQIIHQEKDLSSLLQNSTSSLHLDANNVLWVSQWPVGLSYVNLQKNKFTRLLSEEDENGNSISISSIIEDDEKRIWCGTEKNGVYVFDHNKKQIAKYFYNERGEQSRSVQSRVFPGEDGKIWAVFDKKNITLWDEENEKFEFVAESRTDLEYLTELNNGGVLLGSKSGLFELKEQADGPALGRAEGFTQIKDDDFCKNTFIDSKGNIFINKNAESLIIFSTKGDSISFLEEINQVGFCNDFLETENGEIWVATAYGLLRVALEGGAVKYQMLSKKKDGLPGEVYYGILEDSLGRLWLSSNNGIGVYDGEQKSFRPYSKADGLHFSRFSPYSSLKTKDGDMWFGGIKGLITFHPEKIEEISVLPKVQITKMNLNDEPFDTTLCIEETKALQFEHWENTLSFWLAAPEFSDPEATQFKYFLEGYDKDTVNAETNNFVRYANLPPGKYIFHVKASNSDLIWGPSEEKLSIEILPPFWQKGWFITLMILLGVAGIVGLTLFALRQNLKRKERSRLKEMDELKNRLYANITHEIRTPLTMVLGPIDTSLRKGETLGAEKLQLMRRNGQRLLQLIEQVLGLTKLESGKMPTEIIQADVVKFLRLHVSTYEALAGDAGVDVIFSSSEDSLLMDFDKDKLSDIIANLVSNALKYTASGEKVEVNVCLLRKGAKDPIFEIEVSDTGKGIPAEDLPRIFDRYYQAGNTMRKHGTGIGLAYTKELVQLFGGSIKVQSKLGQGTEFIVNLPFTQEAIVKKSLGPVEKESLDTISLRSVRQDAPVVDDEDALPLLLIVEDNFEMAGYIASSIQSEFRIIFAEDGEIGVQKAIDRIPDIIISDVMMPNKDGFQMTEELKQDHRTSHIPIILLTSRVDKDSRLEGLQRGADDYLNKPFSEVELSIRAKNLFELRKNLQIFYRKQVGGENEAALAANIFAKDDEFLSQFRSYLDENIDNNKLSIEDVALSLNLSYAQLNRKLKALTGQSGGKILQAVRLDKARHLILTTDLNISDIAYDCGYNDPAYLTRVFTKQFGQSPTEFRNEN